MIIGTLITAILCTNACFHGINYGLPKYIVEQNFGLVDVFYRGINVVASLIAFYSLWVCSLHIPSIVVGILLYLTAFGIKKLARHLSYKECL